MNDRNQTIGFVLIFLLTAGYFLFMGYNTPDEAAKTTNTTTTAAKAPQSIVDSLKSDSTLATATPATNNVTSVENKIVTLENDDVKVTFHSKGAVVKNVLLKKQFTHDKKPLYLITETNNLFQLKGLSSSNKKVDLYQYNYQVVQDKNKVTFTYTDSLGNTIQHIYTLANKGYAVTYQITGNGLQKSLNPAAPLELTWVNMVDKVEMDKEQSAVKTTVNYYEVEDEFDQLSEASKDVEEEEIANPVKWFSLKQKYFNIGIINDQAFEKGKFKSTPNADTSKIKDLEASVIIPVKDIQSNKLNFTFYFGPNHYQECKEMGNGYGKNVNLGWPIINGINRFVVIPVFNFLQNYIANYGIIIIILVLLIKLILLPLSYKSYISMAKMKVLKPELDEIKAKFGDDMQKTQAEQMKLYQQVGINPLSGCIPVLLQMPILLAMFNFFPSSFELRQEAFLWAPDLSTYDAPIQLGFTIPFYGSHVSIFTLLMTISTLIYTYLNNQVSTAATGPMKTLSYLMPVVFMFVLNSFPAGLSFYYFMSNVVTIAQQLIIRKFVDEDAIKAQLDANRAKIASGQGGKKSKWMQKVEDAMKAQEELKKNKKK